MKIVALVILLALAFTGRSQDVPIIKLKQLDEILRSNEKKILIVNFWATWCAPCVKELPYFEALNKAGDPDTRIVLINLDFADKLDRVKAFVTRKKMESSVFLLDEIDYNSWIDRVDTSWQGAIPATLIINTRTGQRKFVAKELEEGQLDEIINELSKG
jgi:thiol-disulfide isomerase/thioredoxin